MHVSSSELENIQDSQWTAMKNHCHIRVIGSISAKIDNCSFAWNISLRTYYSKYIYYKLYRNISGMNKTWRAKHITTGYCTTGPLAAMDSEPTMPQAMILVHGLSVLRLIWKLFKNQNDHDYCFRILCDTLAAVQVMFHDINRQESICELLVAGVSKNHWLPTVKTTILLECSKALLLVG